ncbi:molybdopterin-binding protein [Sinimarinibacterium flocculans]|uniref:Putative molybdopterin binding protein n=1 Tax=Sinimarinibacterium flocculans TaxID=985250 RepID=A0A318E8U9_9GAMM|nr:molybdopterin-binding protein [Sinimarinibacterium flocculans]PXV65720.1 putative molybdopterin binding protein [Sinimarinibacterium flocculans]
MIDQNTCLLTATTPAEIPTPGSYDARGMLSDQHGRVKRKLRLSRLAVAHDITHIRLTGGEPQGTDCVLTVGGTGPRDCAVDMVERLITTPLPGFMETACAFGQARTPYAMLPRGAAGLSSGSFIATFPGSRRGAEETLAAVLPGLVHLLDVCRTSRPHEGGYT